MPNPSELARDDEELDNWCSGDPFTPEDPGTIGGTFEDGATIVVPATGPDGLVDALVFRNHTHMTTEADWKFLHEPFPGQPAIAKTIAWYRRPWVIVTILDAISLVYFLTLRF